MSPKRSKVTEKTKSKRRSARAEIKKVVHQIKEPISLLSTFRQEGLANAMGFLTLASSMASQATKRVQLESFKPVLQEMIHSMGFAMKADLEKLEERIEELETKLSQVELHQMEEE